MELFSYLFSYPISPPKLTLWDSNSNGFQYKPHISSEYGIFSAVDEPFPRDYDSGAAECMYLGYRLKDNVVFLSLRKPIERNKEREKVLFKRRKSLPTLTGAKERTCITMSRGHILYGRTESGS
jgi:hypothetical protein